MDNQFFFALLSPKKNLIQDIRIYYLDKQA